MKPLTSRQRQASRPNANAWVTASAGTGKTHVLTARVLHLMLDGAAPDRILCITFTRAAAAQMRERITGMLGEWVRLDDKNLMASISAITGERVRDEQLTRARRLFAEVLDMSGGLNIQTFHGFCQSVLERFPIEAGISPGFAVIDDRTRAELLHQALEEILSGGEKSEDARAALSRMALRAADQTLMDVRNALVSARGKLRRLLADGADRASLALHEKLGLAQGVTADEIASDAFLEPAFDRPGVGAFAKALAGGSDAEAKRAAALAELLGEQQLTAAHWPQYASIFLRQDGEPKVMRGVAGKKLLTANPDVEVWITGEAERLQALVCQMAAANLAAASTDMYLFAAALFDHYEATKSARAMLDFDDLIDKVYGLLADAGDRNWILFKLDGGIEHVLIDEAQDTNRQQWDLIFRLTADFFAGASRFERVRTLFAVGDEKQSIFSFQGAEPGAFEEARGQVSASSSDASLAFDPVRLNRSFRSSAAVLKLVDQVFPAGSHEVAREGQEGMVEVWQPEPVEVSESDNGWQLPVDQDLGRSAEARLATRLAGDIADQIDREEWLGARGRPVREGDYLILVRRRTPFVEYLVRALKNLDVAVAGADRMHMTEQLAVMDLMALADFALLPEDDLTLAVVLKGPLIGLDDAALFKFAHDRGATPIWRKLREAAHQGSIDARQAVDFLEQILASADRTPPFEFFAHILGPMGGRRKLAARLGPEINDPVDEFLTLAQGFEQQHPPSLQHFLFWVRRGDDQIKRDMDEGRNEVRIMTVHGAKGLQAPIVYLPDTCGAPRVQDQLFTIGDGDEPAPLICWAAPGLAGVDALKFAKERRRRDIMAEHDRLLYVALTRAEDRLVICGWRTKKEIPEEAWHPRTMAALQRLPGSEMIADDDGLEKWVLREPQTGDPDRLRAPAAAKSGDVLGEDWMYLPAPSEPDKPPIITPSTIDAPTPHDGTSGRDAERRGKMIHGLLEHLPPVSPGERSARALFYLERVWQTKGRAADGIWSEVAEILDDPIFGPVFEPASRSEVAITGKIGAQILSGRIDRMVVRGDDVLIIDYKSGQRVPDNAASSPTAYLRQMAAYRALAQALYPEKTIRTGLLWTAGPRLMSLDDKLLDKHFVSDGTS